NQAAAQLWGREPTLGCDIWCGAWRVYDPDGQPLAPEVHPMARALRDGISVRNQPLIIERPDGSRRHVLPHPQPIFDARGKISGALSILIDISALREAEIAQRQSQTLAQATLDSLGARVCVLDEQGLVIAVNQAWRQAAATGDADPRPISQDSEESHRLAAGAPVIKAGHDDAVAFDAGLRGVLAGRIDRFERSYACDLPHERRWFIGRVTRLVGSDPLRVVVAHEDITQRTLAERALLENEQRWKFAIEGSVDGLWDYDVNKGRVNYSRRWTELLGHAAQEIGDSNEEWLQRLHPDESEQVLALVNACIDGRAPNFDCEFRIRSRDGSWKWMHGRGTALTRDANGRALRMLGTHTDISARKQAQTALTELESQLHESQKLEAVGTLAGSIAHDFNNIMAAVLGNVALALEDLDPAHPATQNLIQIQAAAQRARSLGQRILSFARRQPHAMHLQPLQPLVHESLDLLRALLPSGVTLLTRLCAESLPVLADATQFSQVLMNLGTNAWHALGGQPGEVEIGVEPIEIDADDANAPRGLPAGPWAHLWLRDDGCGMDEATREHIFEPFFTTKTAGQGTGLGLSVVHAIVHAHHGEIMVDSRPGHGSCFHLYLPLQRRTDKDAGDAPERSVQARRTAPARAAGEHVMYIDDDETIARLVEQMLPRDGFRVSCFGDAQQALAALRAAPWEVDVVVSDYNMPRLSGLDVALAVHRIHPGLPVIISSGSLTDELVDGARHARVEGLLNKERTFEDLSGEILRVLAAAKMPATAPTAPMRGLH
ncbi:MAG: Wide host range VirA protein, partial [Pseudomonadota bacterium]